MLLQAPLADKHATAVFTVIMLALMVLMELAIVVEMLITILAVVMARALRPMFLQPCPGVKVSFAIVTIVMFAGIPPVIPARALAGEAALTFLAFVAAMGIGVEVMLLQTLVAREDTAALVAIVMLALEVTLELVIVVKVLFATSTPTSILEDAAAVAAIFMVCPVMLLKLVVIIKVLLAVLAVAVVGALGPILLQSNPSVEQLVAFSAVGRMFAGVAPMPAATIFGGEDTVAWTAFVSQMSP
ncbi:hypothetical protein BKA70DRAFT_1417393 [Coprinopsis sp. MPI-PUGE-AT-0042]|nr:hypothetical protein BKA70DRAFT_1479041 [Coprinopsis sp. MPI-PUGE-AT-0042]KAH6916611.1 hypothetical protein BKA70DRAFT_1417393 [Coprinopsis sp. MPI-PUGE-AT-0042]